MKGLPLVWEHVKQESRKRLEVINNREHIGVTILVAFAPALSAHTPAHGQERLVRIRESRQRVMKALRGLLLGFAMFTSWFATALIADVQAKSQDEATITLPTRVDPSTEQLLIGVDAPGGRLWCSLDTGFSALVSIDRTKARRMGIVEAAGKPTPDGNSPFRGDGSATVTLQVGPITMRDQPVIVRDFSPQAPDMDCIVGAALLRTHVIEFDYAAGRVQLHAAAGFTSPPGATTVPLVFYTNTSVPFVAAHVDLPDGSGRDLQILVDTGCTYFTLALVSHAATWIQERAATADFPDHPTGTPHLLAARPRRVTVGPFNVAEPVIALISSPLRGVDDGLLGVGFLRRFTVWVDFDYGVMYLLPNRDIRAPQLFDASGLGFKHVVDGYEVDVVLPGTPAASADIRLGDRLLAIDGQRAAELGLAALRERLSRTGERCQLTLERGQTRLIKNLTLAPRL